MLKILIKIFCRHDHEFIRILYGDECGLSLKANDW